MLTRIKPEDAALGMYVHGFAGGWLKHPFWRARFTVTTQDEVARLRDGATDIIIDTAKGVAQLPKVAPAPPIDVIPARRASSRTVGVASPVSRPLAPRRRAPVTFGKADKARALKVAGRSTRIIGEIFDGVRSGGGVDQDALIGVVHDVTKLLESNAFALISVTRLRSKDEVTFVHSLAVCALMINLAREAGLPSDAVADLGVAGLLHDIGKISIADSTLQKRDQLSAEETAELRRHPELGYRLLQVEPGVPPVARDVALHHHERLDGSGYPFGLSGDSISRAARIAAICDVYDAITSDRPYQAARTPLTAVTEMDLIADQFDRDLLFRFMRSLGTYPVGKLIRLRSNRLAIILPGSGEGRLPMARAFYATIGNHFTNYDDVILDNSMKEDQAVSEEDPARWFAENWAIMSARIIAQENLGVSTERRDFNLRTSCRGHAPPSW